MSWSDNNQTASFFSEKNGKRSIRFPIFGYSDIPIFQYSDIPIFRYSDIPIFRHSDSPIARYSDIPIFRYNFKDKICCRGKNIDCMYKMGLIRFPLPMSRVLQEFILCSLQYTFLLDNIGAIEDSLKYYC